MAILPFRPANRARPADADREAALDWLLRLSGEPGAEAECRAWREADPAHEAAWQEANATWQGVAALEGEIAANWRDELDDIRADGTRRRTIHRAAALAASLALVAFFGWFSQLPDARYETGRGQVQRIALADGSEMTLGAASEAEVHFGAGERRLVLERGQAFFAVAPDSGRPFTVIAGDAEVRVTGTQFDVHHAIGAVDVAVLEGRVEVRRAAYLPLLAGDRPVAVLTAGQQAVLGEGADRFGAVSETSLPAGSWRGGRFFYREATLAEIAADLARYSTVPIRVADPAAAGLRVTTSFEVDAIPAFVDNLTRTLPVRQSRDAEGAIVLVSTGAGR